MTQETINHICSALEKIEILGKKLAVQSFQESYIHDERETQSEILGLKKAWQILIDMLPEESQGGFLTWNDIIWSDYSTSRDSYYNY
jgi:hypothetical protein